MDEAARNYSTFCKVLEKIATEKYANFLYAAGTLVVYAPFSDLALAKPFVQVEIHDGFIWSGEDFQRVMTNDENYWAAKCYLKYKNKDCAFYQKALDIVSEYESTLQRVDE